MNRQFQTGFFSFVLLACSSCYSVSARKLSIKASSHHPAGTRRSTNRQVGREQDHSAKKSPMKGGGGQDRGTSKSQMMGSKRSGSKSLLRGGKVSPARDLPVCHVSKSGAVKELHVSSMKDLKKHINRGDYVPIAFFLDFDNDGFGNPYVSQVECLQPKGYVEDSTDLCDENPELQAPILFYEDSDGDTYGNPDVSVAACSKPQGYVEDSTDLCDENPDLREPILFFEDSDGDTYGNPNISQHACSKPQGYVKDSTDLCDENPDLQAPILFYEDSDGDGYGNPNSYQESCSKPQGYVEDRTDLCDENPDLQTPILFYEDSDGDTFGNPGVIQEACLQPLGYVTDSTDLCDENPALQVPILLYEDSDNDGFGNPNKIIEACSEPGFVEDNSDCNDSDSAIIPGVPVPLVVQPTVIATSTGNTPNSGIEMSISLTADSATSDGSVRADIGINIGPVFQPVINVVFVIDTSGSTVSSVLVQEVTASKLLTSEIVSQGFADGSVTISLVPFSTTVGPDATGDDTQTFIVDSTDDTATTDVDDIGMALDLLEGGGWTNYVEALGETLATLKILDPNAEDTNIVYFLSDGQPRTPGGVQTEAEIVAAAAPLHAIASVHAFELGDVNALQFLDAVDNTGGAESVENPTDLSATLLGSPIPEGTVVGARLEAFDASSALVSTVEIDIPGGVDDPKNPNLVASPLGPLELDLVISGLSSILGDVNLLELVVRFDDDGDGLVDLSLSADVEIAGNMCTAASTRRRVRVDAEGFRGTGLDHI